MHVLGVLALAGYLYGALRYRRDHSTRHFEDVNGQLVPGPPDPPPLKETLLWPYYGFSFGK